MTDIQHGLYWRQVFDVRAYELSVRSRTPTLLPSLIHHADFTSLQSVDLVCRCHTPENPDNMLIECTTKSCKEWMHEQCIIDDALRTAYKFLGTDEPHCCWCMQGQEWLLILAASVLCDQVRWGCIKEDGYRLA